MSEAVVEAKPISTTDPSRFLNRDLGLLAFQERVLEEAKDPGSRLLERVKFLSILFSNLDEFFMVRVARLQQLAETHVTEVGADGKPPVGDFAGSARASQGDPARSLRAL